EDVHRPAGASGRSPEIPAVGPSLPRLATSAGWCTWLHASRLLRTVHARQRSRLLSITPRSLVWSAACRIAAAAASHRCSSRRRPRSEPGEEFLDPLHVFALPQVKAVDICVSEREEFPDALTLRTLVRPAPDVGDDVVAVNPAAELHPHRDDPALVPDEQAMH